jgi:hypothetical protein
MKFFYRDRLARRQRAEHPGQAVNIPIDRCCADTVFQPLASVLFSLVQSVNGWITQRPDCFIQVPLFNLAIFLSLSIQQPPGI